MDKLIAGVGGSAEGFGLALEQVQSRENGRLEVIKVVREATGLGLKEAKEMVDNAPKVIKEAAAKAEADELKTKLEAEGAKVTLK